MDIALAVDRLVPIAKYRNAKNYGLLVETWSDERPVPTIQEIEAAWAEILFEREQQAALPPVPTEEERIAALEAMIFELILVNEVLAAQLGGS